MNKTSSTLHAVSTYLDLCAFSKVLLLVPGFGLNILVLVSLVSCLLSQQSKVRSNVAVFILGSTGCNLVNLSMWPMTFHWKKHGRWLLGSQICEVMVSIKHLTSSASFHYVSFITFSIYLTVVCGCGRLVNSRVFLALEMLSPLLPVGLRELNQWISGSFVKHLDPVNHTCFSFINDKYMRVQVLVKTAVFLPFNFYFNAHILHAVIQSAKLTHRSQKANVSLAKVFSLISLMTFTAHLPGAVFSLMGEPSVCHETIRDLVLDLPLVSCPIILLYMNKELRNQCLLLLQRGPGIYHGTRQGLYESDVYRKSLTTGRTVTTSH